jgi:hypothetical protein
MSNSQSASLAERKWPSVGRPMRDLDAWPDQHIETQPMKLAIESSQPSNADEGQVAGDRRSIGSRTFRLPRLSIAVLIGIGAALGWQYYGVAATEIIREQVPKLASLLPVSATKSPVLAATPAEMVQQLLPLTFGLDVVRRSVDQLAAKQEQLTQNIAVLQATVEEDVRQKVSSTPPPPTQQAASIREPKLSQPKARPRTMQPSSMRDR